MRNGLRYSSFLLTLAVLLGFGAVSSAQQPQFSPDFSGPTDPHHFLQLNGNPYNLPVPLITTWGDLTVLRLTDGADNPEASSAYFQQVPLSLGVGQQLVINGFTTYFKFQAHDLQCCNPGDGFAFVVQRSSGTDTSMGARGAFSGVVGASNGSGGGGMGYAGIKNSLAIEFDFSQNAWDPNGNHIAVQTCGINPNTPVHLPGDYTIGGNDHVESCLYNGAIYTPDKLMGGSCNGETCTDGVSHEVVISYTPPSGMQNGVLQIWLDPTFIDGTHTPKGRPNLSTPYNIVYDSENNPLGLDLTMGLGVQGAAWVGFTSSQGDEGMDMDIISWELLPFGLQQIQQVIQPGGQPTKFNFGLHDTNVTYPSGFSNPNGIVMTVVANPMDRIRFYQDRLMGTMFANEQCIAYSGVMLAGGSQTPNPLGNCVVYSYSCQTSDGVPTTCPTTDPCDMNDDNCINIDTSFYSNDNVTKDNADYLENDAIGSNNWFSIFSMYQPKPVDGTTSGGSKGFGGAGGGGRPQRPQRKFLTGDVQNADIVATFRPGQK